MRNRNLLIAAIVLVVLAGVLFWFINSQQATTQTSPAQRVESTPVVTPIRAEEATKTATNSQLKEFTIESKGLNFTPNQLRVSQGDKVKITYKNNVGTHDWRLDEFSVKTELLNAGQQETVEFVASQKGAFEYYCGVPGHKQAGMKGSFIVE